MKWGMHKLVFLCSHLIYINFLKFTQSSLFFYPYLEVEGGHYHSNNEKDNYCRTPLTYQSNNKDNKRLDVK